MSRIIAISNQKGGVGKTTTAVNLGASLGAVEKKTLLVDIDPQANATGGVGLREESIQQKNIYHVLLGEQPIETTICSTNVPNLFVLPSGADLTGFEVEGIQMPEREFCLNKVLNRVRNQYDVILIDCPPSLSLLTLNALTAADGVLVPLQSEYFALEGLSRLVGTIDLVAQQLNPNLVLEGIILTMFDSRNNLAHQVAQEVERHFGLKLWQTRIPRNVKLSEAPSFGKPIITYDIRSIGAQSYLQLAEEFLQRCAITSTSTGDTYDRTQSTGTGPIIADSQLSTPTT